MNDVRLKRVESLIRDKVSVLIMTGAIKDPRVDVSIALTRVKAAGDLSSAQIWVSAFGGEAATRRAVKGLTHAAGFIQSRIGQEIRMRLTPKLSFKADDSIRQGLAVNRLIDKVMNKPDFKE